MKSAYLQRVLTRFSNAPQSRRALDSVVNGDNNLVVSGLRGGAAAAFLAALEREAPRPILILTSSTERAETLADGLSFFGAAPTLFPSLETLPFETGEPAMHIATQRSRALTDLVHYAKARGANGAKPTKASAKSADAEPEPPLLLIAPVDALLIRIPPADDLADLSLRFEWGENHDIDAVARKLRAMGFTRESMVEAPGEFSIRGSILDIYPGEADAPWRLDFFGEQIESIRAFDPTTQRSLPINKETERIRILPRANLAPALDRLEVEEPLAAFFDLLPPDTLLIVDGPTRVEQRIDYFAEVARRHWSEIQESRGAVSGRGDDKNFFYTNNIAPEAWVLSPEEARRGMAALRRVDWVDISLESEAAATGRVEPMVIGAQSFENVPADHNVFLDLVRDKRLNGFLVAIVCDNEGQAIRLDELLAERNISSVLMIDGAAPAAAEPEAAPAPGDESITDASEGNGAAGGDGADAARLEARRTLSSTDVALLVGDLHEGFIFPAAELLVLTDREIFGRYKKKRVARRAFRGKAFKDPTEIRRGDFVVHADHGIGVFERVRRQPMEGTTREFLEISYQDGDKLLVPIEKLFMVQKYSSAEGGKPPAVDKLGKKTWSKRQAKTREAVRKMAGQLLELYARREAAERPPYRDDVHWQREFEASFLYQETPDQLKAIQDVNRDMRGTRPMDRLVCGDVGYGKTEVAIRAAFRALADGRQVAVLSPTTLLSQQHYNNFRERLAPYPFKVAGMSRFQSAAEQKEVAAGLEAGTVNLVIGTHRLLSKDIKFANLGLLVVDEEQRFGVKQKETIKSLRASVDVLTLTATPIPRTLHMAMAKLRDLSLIQTPPADRLPIKTRTIHWDHDQIEEAILRELNRGGQVYFVHNRVESIDQVATTLREIVPHARIAIGHGQMNEDDLEKVMTDFIAEKFDILVATTIIENGIDIPNVNTILVNRADAFGLAQLYQLRGRVGRDVRQAYAYLILPKGKAITDTATQRVSALEEFTELGMGFSIAMRDLEIRGAGNLLGAEQHGVIGDVGFEMYCKLLEEAVQELRGDPMDEPLYPTEIKWPVDQWLPEEYVPIESQRIRIYKELAVARTRDEVEMVREELLDRYGECPAEAKNLLNAFRVKVALAPWRVDVVKPGPETTIRLTAKETWRELSEILNKLAAKAGWVEKIGRRADGAVTIHPTDDVREEYEETPAQALEDLADILKALPVPRGEKAAARA